MEIIIDNQMTKILGEDVNKAITDLLTNPNNRISLRWPSLLEYLGVGSLFTQLPSFDQKSSLFQASLRLLHTYEEKETLFHMFDQLFAENLSRVKDLPQIQPSSLLQAIEQRQEKVDSVVEQALSLALIFYQKALIENTSHTMHDLVLYLAWDRMCISIAHLFDDQSPPSPDSKFIDGLKVLKECLIESYLHITHQGRTSPSAYRLFETLIFYNMRQECLEKHTPAEWAILSQSFQVLKGEEELTDFFYIDEAVFARGESNTSSECCYWTFDSPEKINARLALANLMIEKLKSEFPPWSYPLQRKNIVSLFKNTNPEKS